MLFAYIDQIPPITGRCSNTATLKPAEVQRCAVSIPKRPAPTTTTSTTPGTTGLLGNTRPRLSKLVWERAVRRTSMKKICQEKGKQYILIILNISYIHYLEHATLTRKNKAASFSTWMDCKRPAKMNPLVQHSLLQLFVGDPSTISTLLNSKGPPPSL